MNLTDYGGEFLPELEPEDLSREALVDLVKIYSTLYGGLDGFWYLSVKEKAGNDVALACDMLTWRRQARYELTRLTGRFNIKGNDVLAMMKAFQLTPWYWTLQTRIDVESPAKARVTVLRCPTLEALEKEGQGREQQICNTVEPAYFSAFAAFFNPAIKVACLKAAPRHSRNGIACQWEFTLESGATS